MDISKFDPAAKDRPAWNAGKRVGAKQALEVKQIRDSSDTIVIALPILTGRQSASLTARRRARDDMPIPCAEEAALQKVTAKKLLASPAGSMPGIVAPAVSQHRLGSSPGGGFMIRLQAPERAEPFGTVWGIVLPGSQHASRRWRDASMKIQIT